MKKRIMDSIFSLEKSLAIC